MFRVTILIRTGLAEVIVIANLAFESYTTYWVFATSITHGGLQQNNVPQEVPAEVRAPPAFEDFAIVRSGGMGRQ